LGGLLKKVLARQVSCFLGRKRRGASLDFERIVAGWDIEEKEKMANKERKSKTLMDRRAEAHTLRQD